MHLRGTITAGGQVPGVEVRGWDPVQKKEVVGTASAQTGSAAPDSGRHARGGGRDLRERALRRSAWRPSRHQAAANAIADSLSDHLAGGFAELEGTARGNPKLRAGTAVKVVGVGDQFTGKYVLTSTRHDFSPEHGYRTSFCASNTSERSLYGATNGGARERPQIAGVVPAVVTSAKDPDQLGRVKIKLPWLADTYESWWARTVQPGAGKDRGAAILPEVGDEVLVAFAQGDLEHPYVLGGLYNGVDKPDGGWADHVDGTRVQCAAWLRVAHRHGPRAAREGRRRERRPEHQRRGAEGRAHPDRREGHRDRLRGAVKVQAKQAVEVTTATGDVQRQGRQRDGRGDRQPRPQGRQRQGRRSGGGGAVGDRRDHRQGRDREDQLMPFAASVGALTPHPGVIIAARVPHRAHRRPARRPRRRHAHLHLPAAGRAAPAEPDRPARLSRPS